MIFVNVKPQNSSKIKNSTGALGADYYVDLDISGKNVSFKGKTKGRFSQLES